MKNKASKIILTVVFAGILIFGASFVRAQTSVQPDGQTYVEALITYYQALVKTLREQLNALLAQRGSSVFVLKNKFDEIYSSERNNLIEVSKIGNSRDFYYFTQPLNGLLSMFEATNDTYYLKEAVDLEMNMINAAKDYNHDGILGWPDAPNDTNTDPSYGGEGCFLYYNTVGPELSRTVYLINQYNIKDFQDKAQLIQDFIEKNILSRPWKTGYTFNLRARHLETLLNLYLVTKNLNYYNEIVSLTTKLIATTYSNPNDNKAVLWNSELCKSIRQECYDINGNCPSTWEYPFCFPSDIGHGSNYVEYVINAYNNKILYSKDYLDKLIYTFKKYIWNQSFNYVEFTEFIDGAQEPETGKYLGKGYMGASVNGGWFKLGQYDPEIQLILKSYMNNGKNNPIPLMTADHLIRVGRWNLNWLQLTRYGDLSLNEKILSVSTTTTTSTTKPLTCTDSDSGMNYYVKGIVIYNNQTYTDTCVNSSALKEYSCENGINKETLYTCPNGYICQDGACTISTISPKIQIIKPTPSEIITAGSQYSVQWTLLNATSSDIQTGDRIRMYFDYSGKLTDWREITSNLLITQTSYLWNTPNISCNSCILRVGVYRPSTGYWVIYQNVPIYLKQLVSAATKTIKIINPIGNETVTSTSLPISWQISGFTETEGKIRILFYGGDNWQTVQDNLPLSSGTYNLNLNNVKISDPYRCKIRVGIYNPSTGAWLTWSQNSYTGQYYDESGHFHINLIPLNIPYINLLSPIGNETVTSTSLPISWQISGFTETEGKIRILFYGGGVSGGIGNWQSIVDNLNLDSGSYTLDLNNVKIADPMRCQIRVGIYNPSTGAWLTWNKDSYAGSYYDDSGHFTISTSNIILKTSILGELLNKLTASLMSLMELLKR